VYCERSGGFGGVRLTAELDTDQRQATYGATRVQRALSSSVLHNGGERWYMALRAHNGRGGTWCVRRVARWPKECLNGQEDRAGFRHTPCQ
jgi:hypothetical protein